eukprot:3887751-Rhodomonas_salina.1
MAFRFTDCSSQATPPRGGGGFPSQSRQPRPEGSLSRQSRVWGRDVWFAVESRRPRVTGRLALIRISSPQSRVWELSLSDEDLSQDSVAWGSESALKLTDEDVGSRQSRRLSEGLRL